MLLPEGMKNLFLLFLVLLCFSACRRADTYPDYRNIRGKYKLIYIQKTNTSWPLDSIIRIYYSDKYEIEFKNLSKVSCLKNGHCEKKLKIYSCKQTTANPNSEIGFEMNIDKKDYYLYFPYYLSVNGTTDTFATHSLFYPNEIGNSVNGDLYSCVYFKE